MLERLRRLPRATEQWMRRRPATSFALDVLDRWRRVNASVLAGHIAYRTFVLLVPLMVVVVAAAGFVVDQGDDVGSEAEQRFGIGGVLRTALESAGQDTRRNHVTVGVVGVLGVLFAMWGLFTALRAVFAVAWDIPQAQVRHGAVATFPRFVGGVVVFIVLGLLRQWIARWGLAQSVVGVATSFATGSLVFLGLSWLLPRRTDRWRDLAPGVIACGIGTTLLNVVGAWYFTAKISRSSETYGTLGIVVTVLLYLFILGQLLVGGAVTNATWVDRRGGGASA